MKFTVRRISNGFIVQGEQPRGARAQYGEYGNPVCGPEIYAADGEALAKVVVELVGAKPGKPAGKKRKLVNV